ncbi:hypothetical protein GCM10027447_34830 [Glycomyces halotolerans]
MQNLPVDLGGYKLMVTEAPEMKTRVDKETGQVVPATGYDSDEPQFVVVLFAKAKEANANGRRSKGEEIKVTLPRDPGDGFEEGALVELSGATVSPYEIKEGGAITMSGLSFKARSIVPVGG